jgi:hypothetical protein
MALRLEMILVIGLSCKSHTAGICLVLDVIGRPLSYLRAFLSQFVDPSRLFQVLEILGR